ncbi:MAG: ACP phosphodiesterase [Bacteroidota bacterium]|jgi:acyl carrier protein phosphodiesterase|nr:ACP phosphodiesterase [Bacteroidota bacterium]
MNFLAHLYLAGDSEPIILGNFLGDFVKGRLLQQFEPSILKGIALHRNIDSFTDGHYVVKESKNRLRKQYRHYSGVLVDMYYDHLLAKNWKEFAPHSLEDFTANTYQILNNHIAIFPQKAQYMLPYMIRDNWLLNYRSTKGIEEALQGMAKRTKFKSGLETGTDELLIYYKEFEEEFMDFFPDLIKYVKNEMNYYYL